MEMVLISPASTESSAGLSLTVLPVDAGVELDVEEGVPVIVDVGVEVGEVPFDILDIRYISPEASEDTKMRP